MTDNQTETGNREILPGVHLTPEAQTILTKQLNRRIVWGYHCTKLALSALALLPILIAVFFAYGAAVGGVNTMAQFGLAIFLVCGPVLASIILYRLASRY